MITKFLLYGIIGWCMEILWTGFCSFLQKDYKLTANTSIWMFFIYGMAVFLEPIIDVLVEFPFYLRGMVYVVCIYIVEYLTGKGLKKMNICPWDYSHSKYHISGVIRLDYAPVWFVAGFVFESIYRSIS